MARKGRNQDETQLGAENDEALTDEELDADQGDEGDDESNDEVQDNTIPQEKKTPFCTVDIDEASGAVNFLFGNGEAVSINPNELPEEQQKNLKYHGLVQKVRDSFSSAKGNFEFALGNSRKVIDNLKANKWVAGRESGETKPKTGELAQALANLKGVTLEVAQAAVDRATEEKRKTWRNNAAVAAEIANIRAINARARAEKAKSEDIDFDASLENEEAA